LVKERQWQAEVVRIARMFGWAVYHTHDSRRSEPGWPDLALVRDRLVMVELKTETGRLSDAQVQWIAMLTRAGVETYVWRPSDIDKALEVLQRRREKGKDDD
jgi:hypothetical protein